MYNGFLQSFQWEEAISDGKTFLLRGSTDKTQQEPVITPQYPPNTPNYHYLAQRVHPLIMYLCF